MTTVKWLTGWCEGPNHHLCHHTYSFRNEHGVADYVCTCECHQARPVKKVPRRADTNGQRPVRYIQRRAR